MTKQLEDYPKIWCPVCNEVRPLEVDHMGSDHLNATAAADLLCAECKFIVATLHE